MQQRRAALADIRLPDFGEPTVQPSVPGATYRARMAEALRHAAGHGFDALAVYGDREHAANIAWLTGYDPRFEETLLVAIPGRRPTLFLGNEGWGYAELAAGEFDRALCQSFSLPGQPRDRQKPLAAMLADAGLQPGLRVGAVGWKSFGPDDPGADEFWLDLPEFIAARLRTLAGPEGAVVNATNLFIDPANGLRTINDVDQLACFEFAATYASEALKRVIFGVRPGMTELEAARLMRLNGLPLAAHTMLSSGPRAVHGLPSPGMTVLERGAPFTMACAPQGGLSARAGFLVADAAELPDSIRDYVPRLVAPYFEAVAAWYQAVGLGTEGGSLHAVIHDRLGDPFFGIGLNPGHLIGMDEWLHSPI
ncbi:MAG TPA: hypothetical protein VGC80_15400, partial [Acetobacteraceae bacterium]